MHRLGEQLPFTIRKTMRRTDARSTINTPPYNPRLILVSIMRRSVLSIGCDKQSAQPPPIVATRHAGGLIPGNPITRKECIRAIP
jgi:hypothetical protein